MKKGERGKKSKRYEPKKSSPEPQSGTEEQDLWYYGAISTAHTRTAIKEFVENYDRVREKYSHII